jgi:hypothetical protein
MVGTLQTNEAIKLAAEIGEPLVGRLLLFDALDGAFSEVRLQRDPACPTCSDEARSARERGDWVAPAAFGADQPFVLGGAAGGNVTFGGPAR